MFDASYSLKSRFVLVDANHTPTGYVSLVLPICWQLKYNRGVIKTRDACAEATLATLRTFWKKARNSVYVSFLPLISSAWENEILQKIKVPLSICLSKGTDESTTISDKISLLLPTE